MGVYESACVYMYMCSSVCTWVYECSCVYASVFVLTDTMCVYMCSSVCNVYMYMCSSVCISVYVYCIVSLPPSCASCPCSDSQ